jgi:hypothetical protein
VNCASRCRDENSICVWYAYSIAVPGTWTRLRSQLSTQYNTRSTSEYNCTPVEKNTNTKHKVSRNHDDDKLMSNTVPWTTGSCDYALVHGLCFVDNYSVNELA